MRAPGMRRGVRACQTRACRRLRAQHRPSACAGGGGWLVAGGDGQARPRAGRAGMEGAGDDAAAAARSHYAAASDGAGLYNPLTASWVVPPKQPERERGKDHSGIEALNKRVGVYDPLRAEWKQTPAASSDERGRDRSGIEAMNKRVGVYDPLRAEWKQTPEGFVERPPPQMHELRGEYADSLKYSQRNRSHDSISWEEASPKPMHRAPAAPDRWDPAAKTIPRGSVGGGAPPPPSMRAAPSGRCSPERRRWVSKTMPKATRVSNSDELPAWRPADDSEKNYW